MSYPLFNFHIKTKQNNTNKMRSTSLSEKVLPLCYLSFLACHLHSTVAFTFTSPTSTSTLTTTSTSTSTTSLGVSIGLGPEQAVEEEEGEGKKAEEIELVAGVDYEVPDHESYRTSRRSKLDEQCDQWFGALLGDEKTQGVLGSLADDAREILTTPVPLVNEVRCYNRRYVIDSIRLDSIR